MNKKCIAIIPARGGSKRIPRKNIRDFLGEPIISYPIKAALGSMLFEEVMVSTDDEEIARVAKTFGAVVPFMRSKETSNDFSTTAEVMIEVLKDYKQKGCEFDMACCIYPTASLMTSARLKKAYELLVNSDASSLIPITKFSSSIWRYWPRRKYNPCNFKRLTFIKRK